MTLPEFIGHPGKQLSGAYGGDFDKDYDNFVDDKLIIATLKPGLPKINGSDANVYDLQDAWGKYSGDLSNLGISTGKNNGKIQIVISNLSPIQRTYGNNYGDSNLLPRGNVLGDSISDILQLGGRNTEELEKFLKQKNGNAATQATGKLVGGYNALIDALRNGGQEFLKQVNLQDTALSSIVEQTARLAKSPQSKIGWPKMWRDCSFGQSYELNTRLYCFSTDNSEDYNNNIKACIAALELFVCPKSDDGILYTAPYMVEFDIPGMIHFPQAYVESMTVIEGGNEGDFAQTGRPNVVDINMTIQNNYSISTNTPPPADMKHPGRPTIRKDIMGLASGRNLGKKSSYTSGTGSSTAPTQNKSYQDAAKEQLSSEIKNAEDIANANATNLPVGQRIQLSQSMKDALYELQSTTTAMVPEE